MGERAARRGADRAARAGPAAAGRAWAVPVLLRQAGFADTAVAPVDHAIEIGADAEEATRFSATVGPMAGLLREIEDPGLRERALAVLRRAMPAERPVRLGAACWLATAVNPG